MAGYTLTKTGFAEGVWYGVVTAGSAGAAPPEVRAELHGNELPAVTLRATDDPASWALEVAVPRAALAEGVQTVLIREVGTESLLGSFAILAGDALADDLRAEVDLLRAELDMLKRAFRRDARGRD